MSSRLRQRMRRSIGSLGILTMLLPVSLSGLQFASAAGVTVTGRIVDPNGAPLSGDAAGAWIQLDPVGGGPGMGENTNSSGEFTFSNVAAGAWQMMINYGGSGNFVGPEPQNFNIGGSNINLGDIRLATPQITGTALAPTGSTVLANTSVSLQSADFTVNRWGQTAENGTFKFGALRRGNYTITVMPAADSGYTNGKINVELVSDSSVVTGLQLRATTPNVLGTIVEPDGTPLTLNENEGERVNIDIANQDRTYQEHVSAGSDGSFAFGGVPAGAYVLEVRTEGLPYTNAVPKNITVGSTVLNVGNIRLTTAQVQGTVTDPDGVPVPNAFVQIHNDDWSVQSGTNTDQNGQYRLGGIANGTYRIGVQTPWDRSDLIAPDESTITVTSTVQNKNFQFIEPTKFLTGRVLRQNGQPVSNAQINAFKESGFGWANAEVDANGNYSLALSPGTWNVMPQPPHGPNGPEAVDWIYSGFPKQVPFANNQNIENKQQNFTVQTADAEVRGRLVRSNGSPVSDANVDLRTQEGAGSSTRPNPDGTFSMPVVSGSYRLNVWTSDTSLLFPERGVTIASGEVKNLGNITATTKDARIIVRTIKDNGQGIPGMRVSTFKHGSQGWSQSTTNSDGVAELAVTEGPWGVNIEAGPDARYVRTQGAPIDINVPESNSVISYTSDERLVVELTHADATITGNVVDNDGNVITGFCGWAFARPNTNSGGNFHQEYGGPVNCQQGSYTIYVPSEVASTFTIGVHTPPNSNYSPAGDQNVAVFADTTSEKNIVMLENDASIVGHLVDQNGDAITSCTGDGHGFGGWVDVSNFEKGIWFGGELRPDCTYSINLLSGEGYNMNVWVGEGGELLNRPPSHDGFTVTPGQNTRNHEVVRADRTISGRVTDPDGNGVDAFVFAHKFNGDNAGPPTTEEEFANELFTGTKTDADGNFSLGVIEGVWEVGGGLPPEVTDLLPPQFVRVNMNDQTSAVVNLSLQEALGQMRGQLLFNGSPVDFGFVSCWDETTGTFSGAPADFGSYALNYAAGTFTCQADSFNGNQLFRSDEVIMTFTDQESVEQDFTLELSDFVVPNPIVSTFDAGSATVLTFENGTSITIPAGALGQSGENVTVTATPTVSVRKTKNVRPFGTGYELTATDANSSEITTFNQNVTIKFTYDEEQLASFGLTEAGLSAQYYAEDTNTWRSPTSVSVDTERNEISVLTNHFTTFAVTGSGAGIGGAKSIVVSAEAGGGPHVTTWNSSAERTASFTAYAPGFRGGVETLMTDLDGDGTQEIVTVPYSAGGPHVRVFDNEGNYEADLFPFPAGYRGGLSIASGDVDGDGTPELVVAPSTAGGPHVRTYEYDGSGFALKGQFFAYPLGYRGGVNLAVGDTDGDGQAEIVTSTNSGATPHVRVLDYAGNVEGQFFAYAQGYRGGVNVTLANVDGSAGQDIIASPKWGGPHVRVFRPDGSLLSQFFAFPSQWRLGLTTGAGDVNGDGTMDIVVAPTNGGPHIRVYDWDGGLNDEYMAYAPEFRGGIEVHVADINGDGDADVITNPKSRGGPHIRVFHNDGTIQNIMALHPNYRGGTNVAISQ